MSSPPTRTTEEDDEPEAIPIRHRWNSRTQERDVLHFEACRTAGEPEPRLRSLANDLWLEFPFAPDYLAANAASTPEVTPEVRRMLSVVVGEMNRAEIMSGLGLRDEKHFREQYQQAGIAAGVIEMTIPDKPNSRLQKYRLTAVGQRLASRLRAP